MFGWFSSNATQTALSERVHIVTPKTIMQWLGADECVIVDVREPGEYAAGHIPGATLVSLGGFDPEAVPLVPGKKLVFHCQSGNRCGMAATRMVEAGYAGEIYRMEGGLMYWRQQGGSITLD